MSPGYNQHQHGTQPHSPASLTQDQRAEQLSTSKLPKPISSSMIERRLKALLPRIATSPASHDKDHPLHAHPRHSTACMKHLDQFPKLTPHALAGMRQWHPGRQQAFERPFRFRQVGRIHAEAVNTPWPNFLNVSTHQLGAHASVLQATVESLHRREQRRTASMSADKVAPVLARKGAPELPALNEDWVEARKRVALGQRILELDPQLAGAASIAPVHLELVLLSL